MTIDSQSEVATYAKAFAETGKNAVHGAYARVLVTDAVSALG